MSYQATRFAKAAGAILIAGMALLVPSEVAAQSSTTYASDGSIWQTYDDPFGSTMYGPNGEVYQTYDDPFGSTMYGPNGEVYQTYEDDQDCCYK